MNFLNAIVLIRTSFRPRLSHQIATIIRARRTRREHDACRLLRHAVASASIASAAVHRCYLPRLGAVLAAAALAAVDAQGVERAADDVVAHAGQVAHAAAADQHDAVFLQVVLFAGDVGGDFLAVAQAHAGDLPQGRVGLLGGHGLDLKAHAALLRAGFQVLDLVDARPELGAAS